MIASGFIGMASFRLALPLKMGLKDTNDWLPTRIVVPFFHALWGQSVSFYTLR